MSADLQGTVDPVLMKAIAPVGATEKGAIDPVDFTEALPSPQSLWRIDGMVIDHRLNHFIWINLMGQIKTDTYLIVHGKALEDIHIIG